jgi:hypothetical protein
MGVSVCGLVLRYSLLCNMGSWLLKTCVLRLAGYGHYSLQQQCGAGLGGMRRDITISKTTDDLGAFGPFFGFFACLTSSQASTSITSIKVEKFKLN